MTPRQNAEPAADASAATAASRELARWILRELQKYPVAVTCIATYVRPTNMAAGDRAPCFGHALATRQ